MYSMYSFYVFYVLCSNSSMDVGWLGFWVSGIVGKREWEDAGHWTVFCYLRLTRLSQAPFSSPVRPHPAALVLALALVHCCIACTITAQTTLARLSSVVS